MSDLGMCGKCNNEFLFKNMEAHLKGCYADDLEKWKSAGDLYVLRVETKEKDKEPGDKWTASKKTHYWFHMVISKDNLIPEVNQAIRTIWLKCCDDTHLTDFINGDKTFTNGELKGDDESWDTEYSNLSRHLYDSVKVHFDSVLTTRLTITLIQIIKGAKESTPFKIKILSQNKTPRYQCATCEYCATDDLSYCIACQKIVCPKCLDEHKCFKIKSDYLKLTNDPRTGVACEKLYMYERGKLATDLYLTAAT
ncbi:MAG: hypothetical protein Hyperionvirus4_54 [Hyperionvirus sp.]|uniref:Uncharacterized protein n=1 Tax=Hyperionvirus sp. TaxID=2487770 RepID=A0A3G5ACM7_9VIRU|nr:MAG: hypothetical protein Hyperionvirus4_54 [Hyperionvirus sp.]